MGLLTMMPAATARVRRAAPGAMTLALCWWAQRAGHCCELWLLPRGWAGLEPLNSVTTLYQELYGIELGSYDSAGTLLKERTIRALALARLWWPSTAPPPA